MVEEPGVQFDDVGIPALVFRMTDVAVTAPRRFEEPVKTGTVRTIAAYTFVACHTKQGSRLVGLCIVAGTAIAFELCVSGYDAPRHHEFFYVSGHGKTGAGVCQEDADDHRNETKRCCSTMCRRRCHRE